MERVRGPRPSPQEGEPKEVVKSDEREDEEQKAVDGEPVIAPSCGAASVDDRPRGGGEQTNRRGDEQVRAELMRL